MSQQTDAKHHGITYTYHPLTSRLTQIAAPDTTISFAYDALGGRSSMTGDDGTSTYSYDARHRLTQKVSPAGTVNFTYDDTGNLISLNTNYGNGPSLTFQPDTLNRRASVTSGSLTTNDNFDASGNLSGIQLPNTRSVTYGYDDLNRLTSTAIASVAGFNLGGNREQTERLRTKWT